MGLIVPHAGYRYSGATAGQGYACLKGLGFDLCVVVSPLHQAHPAQLLTSAHQVYETPLGQIKLDLHSLRTFQRLLFEDSGITLTEIANDAEHSLEIQLPFLQVVLGKPFQLLPLMVRSESEKVTRVVGETLAKVVSGLKVLLVASTDLSHFYPEHEARVYDHEMLAQFESFSPEGVLQAERTGKGFACGAGAVAVVLQAARALGANKVTLVDHSTSADATHDPSSVVGYGAALITKSA
jgi:AmmeMemoRadiSam system protein B